MTAAASALHRDQRVSIAGKGLGTIAFIGKTDFADGDWIGVILDEPKGKNNGTVLKKDGKSVRYFSCNDNHGLYIRPGQIESVIDESPPDLPESASNNSIKSQASSNGSADPSTTTKSSKQTAVRAPSGRASSRPPGLSRTTQSANDIPKARSIERVSSPKENAKPSPPILPKPPSPTFVQSTPPPAPISIVEPSESQLLVSALKTKVADQEEQIQTLIKKRRDDLEKLKEFERTKLQLDQLLTYKHEAQERMKDMNDKLQHEEHELKDVRDKFTAYRDEMSDTELRIESLALDLELAEEQFETVTSENAVLKANLEETQLELEIVKGELQLNGQGAVTNGIQKKVADERTVKMEQALIKLRDLALHKQAENDALKKQCETLELKMKVLTKENESAKANISTMQSTITDLQEQVDTCLGAQQMLDTLSTKNLSLEDQVRELQETVDNLETLCDMDKEIEENAREVEHDLRENIDLMQNQLREKERQIEQLQYTIGDHERTILKFRETVKNVQLQNEQSRKQLEKYDEQMRLADSVQSGEFKAKIIETKSYGELIDGELKKLHVSNLSRHVQLLTLFLPEQLTKRGGDHDCILVLLLVQRLISKCDLLTGEIRKKFDRISQLTVDDVMKSHRAEQWSFACQLSQSIAIFRMILGKYLRAMEGCPTATLRQLAGAHLDLASHEKTLDLLIDRLQKDQLHDSISLNTLDKPIAFYETMYKTYLSEQRFSMASLMQDLARVVLFSNDVLDTDIQRVRMLQKEHGESGNDQSPFTALMQRLTDSNDQLRIQAGKINRLSSQQDGSHGTLIMDTNTMTSMESATRHLDRLAKTFYEICSGLTTRILMLSNADERVSVQDVESIAYQACDKIYKKEDGGPYDSLWDSMQETVSVLDAIGSSLENGSYDSNVDEPAEKPKQAIFAIADELKVSMNESTTMRARLELKDEELLDLKKLLKAKHDDLSELNIRLALNEKRVDSLQKETDERTSKHRQSLEEVRIDAQKRIKQCEDAMAVLQNDNEQLEQEKSVLQERLKQLTKTRLLDDLVQRSGGGVNKLSGVPNFALDAKTSSLPQRSPSDINDEPVVFNFNAHEVEALRSTIRLLKDELWHLKMSHTSNDLAKLQLPVKETKASEIANIYKDSTLLLNDLFTTIAGYKITGENVAAKQEVMRSKMRLVNQTAVDLNTRLSQCQNHLLPGSAIQTTMQTFLNPQFVKSLAQDRQLAAEIQLPGSRKGTGGEFNVTEEQYRTIMREAIGCI